MRKQWIAVAVAVIGVSMSALGLAAQGPGPMGAGAGGGNTKQSSKAPQSSAKQSASDNSAPHARRSLNPIKWIKKDSNKGPKQSGKAKTEKAKTEKAKTTKAKATKSSTKQAMNDDPTPRARRSYNPVNWFKKDHNKATDKSKKTNTKKPAGKSTTSETPARPVDA